MLALRRRDALARLNPDLPAEALEDAFRRIMQPDGATLEARNRTAHRALVDGVTVEYRRQDGSIAGAQAKAIDFGNVNSNDWLAVNQFTVSENRHTRRPDGGSFTATRELNATSIVVAFALVAAKSD